MRPAFAAIAVLAFLGLVHETYGAEVDLEVILTADVSRSIYDAEFDLQRKGYAAALDGSTSSHRDSRTSRGGDRRLFY